MHVDWLDVVQPLQACFVGSLADADSKQVRRGVWTAKIFRSPSPTVSFRPALVLACDRVFEIWPRKCFDSRF